MTIHPAGDKPARPARASCIDVLAGDTTITRLTGDARRLAISDNVADVCITSPPYWRKRDYGHAEQIGQEKSIDAYVLEMQTVFREIRRVLKPSGSLFVNIGDSYVGRSLAGVPFLLEAMARADGWRVRNRIVWTKPTSVPTPHRDRLGNRYEFVLHLTGDAPYFYDSVSLSSYLESRTPGGDVWDIAPARHLGEHPAAFPEELAARIIALACPRKVCGRCGKPSERIIERGIDLDLRRPQARRALELYREHRLTTKHLAAIRATGISDAGKGARLQRGATGNTPAVRRLAAHAKRCLGGYFREFTFAAPETVGYTACACKQRMQPGLILDVFAGTGTTLKAAEALGRRAIGVDLLPWEDTGATPRRGTKRS